MRVDGAGRPGRLMRAQGRVAGQAVFTVPEPVQDAIAAAPAFAPPSISPVLPQPLPADAATDGARNRAGRRHGRAMLDALAGMQRALLGEGAASAAVRAELATLNATLPEVADPRLAATLQAIRTRIAVELARSG